MALSSLRAALFLPKITSPVVFLSSLFTGAGKMLHRGMDRTRLFLSDSRPPDWQDDLFFSGISVSEQSQRFGHQQDIVVFIYDRKLFLGLDLFFLFF